jgi:hypothetical protein
VILLGNPAFDPPRAAPMKTRFKLWYRHVGAAVEHAARCAAWINPDADHVPDQVLDFGSLFLDQEAEDEDATSLAEMLHALDEAMAGRNAALGRQKQPFKAGDVAGVINCQRDRRQCAHRAGVPVPQPAVKHAGHAKDRR